MEKPKFYKIVVTSTYEREIIVKANSLEEVEDAEETILKSVNLLEDDMPDIESEIYERTDYDDDDAEFDLTEITDKEN